MKAQRFARTKAVGQGSAIALVTAALVFAAFSFVINATQSPSLSLTASNNFSITSAISSSPSTQTSALLEPGATRYLWYTVHNSLSVPITVNALSITNVSAPAGCAASNLDVSNTTFSGSLVVLAKVGAVVGTNSVAKPITLSSAAGDGCKNVTFNFTFSGSASYTEVYGTSTAVASSQNPSAVGQSVTYTATVTGSAGAGQDPLPSSPTGKVTFKDGATTICSNVTVTSSSATASTAQCTPSTYAATGTHAITAVFTNSDGNFSGSTSSPALNQVVGLGTTTALTSAPNPSIQGSAVTLTATVTKTSGSGTPAGSVSFYSGTPSGTHTLLGTGTLNSSAKATLSTSALAAGADSLYAVYAGNGTFVPSTSPVITQTVIALPGTCSGTFNLIVGNPASPTVNGTNGNDFIYAPGTTNWVINGGNGNDCIQTGDGNNTITAGNGDNKIVAGNGKNTVTVGNGSNSVTIGNGSNNKVTAGNGTNTVTFGTGANNVVTMGNGANTVTIQTAGNHDTITAGNGKNTIFLGGGTFNTFTGGKSGNTCHLPSLPASTYHDTLTNCTAVTP